MRYLAFLLGFLASFPGFGRQVGGVNLEGGNFIGKGDTSATSTCFQDDSSVDLLCVRDDGVTTIHAGASGVEFSEDGSGAKMTLGNSFYLTGRNAANNSIMRVQNSLRLYDKNESDYATLDPRRLYLGWATMEGNNTTRDAEYSAYRDHVFVSTEGSIGETMRIKGGQSSPNAGFVGIGTADPINTLTVTSGWSCNYATPATTYTVLITDCMVDANSSGGTFTVTLPTLATARNTTDKTSMVVTVCNNYDSAVDITLDGDGAEEIDSETTQPIYAGNCATLQPTAIEWRIK